MNTSDVAVHEVVDGAQCSDYKGASFPFATMTTRLPESSDALGIPSVPSRWGDVSTFLEIMEGSRFMTLLERSRNGHLHAYRTCADALRTERQSSLNTHEVDASFVAMMLQMVAILQSVSEPETGAETISSVVVATGVRRNRTAAQEVLVPEPA